MKTIIITLILAFAASAGMAQSKQDTIKYSPMIGMKATEVKWQYIDAHIREPFALFSRDWDNLTHFVTMSDHTQVILSISQPDSSKVITVTFTRSRVHFINDSTFTFKQQ